MTNLGNKQGQSLKKYLLWVIKRKNNVEKENKLFTIENMQPI